MRFYLPVESSQNVHVERERERERETPLPLSLRQVVIKRRRYEQLYDRIVIKRKVQRCHGRSHHLLDKYNQSNLKSLAVLITLGNMAPMKSESKSAGGSQNIGCRVAEGIIPQT